MIPTHRLILRPWQPADREPFAALNADARVMEFMPACLTRTESDQFADRIENHFREHGFGLYVVELRADHQFIGFAGFHIPSFQAHFTPCIEIGWRLAADHWGQGLATEASHALILHAFDVLNLNELVSFTFAGNMRSRRVMEKIKMTHDPAEDFDHPGLPPGHPLCRHVLYRLTATGQKH